MAESRHVCRFLKKIHALNANPNKYLEFLRAHQEYLPLENLAGNFDQYGFGDDGFRVYSAAVLKAGRFKTRKIGTGRST
jgi:hypothetical protein